MDINTLEQKLNSFLDNYNSQFSNYDEYDKSPATKGEITYIAKSTYCVLSEFKEEIIKYLKTCEK